MDDTAVNDIARLFRRLQWALAALAACWLVWLMGPVLTPFVVPPLLAGLGDPLVDRLQPARRSRNTAVVPAFAPTTLLIALALLPLVPTLLPHISPLGHPLQNHPPV